MPAEPGLLLWNVAEGRPEQVPADQVQGAIASGKYLEGPPTVTQGEGSPVIRGSSTVASAGPQGEQDTAVVAAHGVEEREQSRRDRVATGSDKALTFAEGVVDALSLGLIHEHGTRADLRRDVNSGYALVGELTGTALGLALPGPVKWVADAGKAAGGKAAKAVIGEMAAGSAPVARGAVAVRAAEGAGEMSALMGAASIGHQVSDAVLEDKDFSAAAVVHEAGLGALLGGGFSLLSGVFGRAASRYEVKAQGGLLDAESAASKGLADHVSDAKAAWDGALQVHEARLGVLKQLEAEGLLDNTVPEFMAKREVQLARARGARVDLEGLDFERALSGDEKAWRRWHGAMERYQRELASLDDLMAPRNLERMRATEPSIQPRYEDPGAPVTENLGIPMDDVAQMDALMKNPARAAEYERLYGRPYESQAQYGGGEPLPGGKVSPTSELTTPARTPRSVQGPAAGPRSLTGRFDVSDAPYEPLSPAAAAEPRVPTPAAPAAPVTPGWAPSSPAGRFNPAEWTPMGPAKTVDGRPLYPDGTYGSAADVRQNAEVFSKFLQSMQPTPLEGLPGSAGVPTPVIARPGAQASTEVTTPVIQRPMARPPGSYAPTPVVERSFRGSTEPTPVLPREPLGPVEAPEAQSARSERQAQGKAAVRRYLDEWYATAEAQGPRFSPGDYAAQELRRSLENIRNAAGGREVAAGLTDLGKKIGLPEATSQLGAELNDIYAMRKLADVAAGASKKASIKGLSSSTSSRLIDWMTRRAGGQVGAAVAGGLVGKKLGGPAGFFVGALLAHRYVGFAGRAAGMAGRLYQASLKAANGLLKGRRASFVARAAAGNRPRAYSDRGPINDPVERVQELQRVAQTPATLTDYVAQSAGDLNLVSPTLVTAMTNHVMAQVQFLLEMAPSLQYDQLGRVIPPKAGAMRRFLEAENAVFDLKGVLAAVENGTVTRVQVEALRRAHTPVYTRIAAFLLDDPEKLARLERAKLRTIGMVVGAPMTPGDDPLFVMRQQAGWAPQQVPGQEMAAPAQALKIPGAGGPPSEAPTPSQAYGMKGRAPGN